MYTQTVYAKKWKIFSDNLTPNGLLPVHVLYGVGPTIEEILRQHRFQYAEDLLYFFKLFMTMDETKCTSYLIGLGVAQRWAPYIFKDLICYDAWVFQNR